MRASLRSLSAIARYHTSQTDLFSPSQPDLFGPEMPPSYLPDPGKVRDELLGVLAKARAAPHVPWAPAEIRFYRTVFPQMANWLPAEVADRLRSELASELVRLEAELERLDAA